MLTVESGAGSAGELTIQQKSAMLTSDLDQSILPLALKTPNGPDSSVNTLIGLDSNGRLYRRSSPGDSVFVGSSASLDRSQLSTTGGVPATPSDAAGPSEDHASGLNQKTFPPSAGVFRFLAATRTAKADAARKSLASAELSDLNVASQMIESFAVGNTAVTIPIGFVAVIGALDSSLANLIGTSDRNDFDP